MYIHSIEISFTKDWKKRAEELSDVKRKTLPICRSSHSLIDHKTTDDYCCLTRKERFLSPKICLQWHRSRLEPFSLTLSTEMFTKRRVTHIQWYTSSWSMRTVKAHELQRGTELKGIFWKKNSIDLCISIDLIDWLVWIIEKSAGDWASHTCKKTENRPLLLPSQNRFVGRAAETNSWKWKEKNSR